jgi:hypothetical protein
MELFQSVDRLLAADQTLRAAVAHRIGPASAQAFDWSAAANRLGVFSKDVQVLGETVHGDQAEVTIQVADRLPLQNVVLVRRKNLWQIQTDRPIPGAAAEIRQMANVLNEAARSLHDHPKTLAELRTEIGARQQAIARRLAAKIPRENS